jgi:membrane protein
MKANKEELLKIKHFFEKDLWITNTEAFPFWKKCIFTVLRTLVFTIKRYLSDRSTIKASALTYYTLMSIVPLLALILGIARGFGLDDLLENELRNNVLTMNPTIGKVFEFSKNMIENAKGGVFTGLGMIVLFYAVIKGLGNIENSFNSIWNVNHKRSLARQFSDYLSVMILLPIFFIALSGINVFIVATMQNLGAEYSLFGTISPYLIHLMKFVPYVIIWILFIFLYIFIPNTKVKIIPAVISGILIGTLVQLLQWGYIEFQIGVASYNAIYGSFAAIPLLLIFLQLMWSLVLVGAQLCYYIQNYDDIDPIDDGLVVSDKSNRVLLISILNRVTVLFKEGSSAETAYDISKNINSKYSHVKRGINVLIACGFLEEVNRENDNVFLPAVDIYRMNVASILNKIDAYGSSLDYELKGISNDFINKWDLKYENIINKELGDVLIMDINKLV